MLASFCGATRLLQCVAATTATAPAHAPKTCPTPFDDDALPAHALRIGTRNVWLAYDSYADPDMLTAYVEL